MQWIEMSGEAPDEVLEWGVAQSVGWSVDWYKLKFFDEVSKWGATEAICWSELWKESPEGVKAGV